MEKYYEKIKNYLENVFASLPNDDAVLRMKNDMYCSMLDKFNNLVQGGANEDEAFGKVVGEFGSLAEIRAVLGIDANAVSASGSIPVSPERTKQYSRYKIIQGILIAVGVILCIIAVFMYPLYGQMLVGEAENFVFGLLIAIGVFLFVFAGTNEARYFDVTKPMQYAVPPTAERVKEYQKFLAVRSLLISFAVFLFIMSVFAGLLFEGWLFELIAPPIMVAVGVAILIIVGSIHSSYKDVSGRK